jgi:tetratricopeptide (TPR) repeat protein
MNKRLNLRLLLRVGVALVVLSGLGHLVHIFQVRRQARAFHEEGYRAAEEKDFQRSTIALGRYLALRPDDLETRLKYGILLGRVATTPTGREQAYRHLVFSLRKAPDNVEARETLGQLAVQLGRFREAARQLEPLRLAHVDRAELEQTLAWCYLGAGDRREAVRCFENAIRQAPARVVNYVQLAELFQRAGQPQSARAVMDRLVRTNGRSAEALAARARFQQQIGRLDDAARDLARARSLAPNEAGLLLEEAELARTRDHLDDARRLLRQGMIAHRDEARFALALAQLEQDLDCPAEALAVLRPLASQESGIRSQVSGVRSLLLALLGEMLFERGEVDEARRLLVAAQSGNRDASTSRLVEYLEACSQMQRGQWVRAARQLERLRGSLGGSPFWMARVQGSLARCYRACGDPAREVEAGRQAVAADPVARAPREALAEALVSAGHLAEACREWATLMDRPQPPRRGWLGWARALVRWTAARPVFGVGWVEVEQVLAEARRAGADPVERALVAAESLLAREQPDRARQLLEETAGRHPGRGEPLLALADLAAARGERDASLRLLDELCRRPALRHTVEWRLAQARRIAWGPETPAEGKAVADRLASATSQVEALSPTEQSRLMRTLVSVARGRGDLPGALRLCRRWGELVPHDLSARLVLFDLSVEAGEDTTMSEAIRELRRIEGDEGVRWRCGEAVRLSALGDQRSAVSRQPLAASRKLLGEAARLEPGWGRVTFLLASLDEREGHFDRALEGYLRAFQQGERHEGLTERLMQALNGRKRFLESEQVLRLYERSAAVAETAGAVFAAVPGRLPVPPALARLGCETALELHDSLRAVELARLAVREDARDYRDHLWLAGVLTTAGRTSEARRVLERLVERSGDVAEVWVALVRHLAREEAREAAEDALARAQRHLSGEDPQYIGLGQCFEALAKVDQAEQAYRLALTAAPADPLARRQLARFYLAQDRPEEALPHLRALSGSPFIVPEQAAWARRMLATLPFQVVVLGDPVESAAPVRSVSEAEALGLLRLNQQGKESVADRRARALVVGTDPRRRPEAVRLFEETLPLAPLTAEEQFRLAQLREAKGDHTGAGELMLGLLASEPRNAQFLAGQVRRLLAWGDRAGARHWLRHLQKVEPDTPRTRALAKRTKGQ